MELWDYQLKVKQEIYLAWENGAQNILAQMPTGAGKTVLFSNILAEEKQKSIAIVHRNELVGQISLTLARHGIRHNIIAQKNVIRDVVAIHMQELNCSYFNPQADCIVASVDTLVRKSFPWFNQIKLVVQDEAHHVLKNNKWGKVAALFPKARGLYPTATPIRADGRGLGRKADGIIDVMVQGPSMKTLINRGFLTDYRIVGPPCSINFDNIPIGNSGDFSRDPLQAAVQKAKITGNVVEHYLKFSPGKLGITFAVSVAAATEIAGAFRSAGITAEVISAKTPDLLRNSIMRKFRNREILQLINVDILGEGVDVPAIEVVSMARPTRSYAVYAQQFGRALRPMPGKKEAIIIDHVDNVKWHKLPDLITRTWSLDRRERTARSSATDAIPLKSCLNKDCFAVYPRTQRACPFCGLYTPPAERSAPEFVDGDLTELSQEALAMLRGEVERIDALPKVPQHLDNIAQRAIINRHYERQRGQGELRKQIALWAGFEKSQNKSDSEIYRTFYFTFGIDIMGAQALNARDSEKLAERINENLTTMGVIEA